MDDENLQPLEQLRHIKASISDLTIKTVEKLNTEKTILEKERNIRRLRKEEKRLIIRKENIQKEVLKYQEFLGIKICKSNSHTMAYKFRNVFLKNPETECIIELTLNAEKYIVPYCHPKLKDIGSLVEYLNANDNFADFLCAVRKAWQMLENESTLESVLNSL